MTTAANNLESTLLSSSLGQSVLDAIVQANLDMNTVSQTTVENMMRVEEQRRGEPGRFSADQLHSVCG